MKEKKAFCEECGNEVSYITSEIQMEGTVKGERCSYLGKRARCADCGSVVDAPEVKKYNQAALQGEYRERNGIISLDRILELPGRYAIGKRPLSLILGWGEQTFSRYCEGDLPTRQYSEMLLRIYEEPDYYMELLEANKDKLKVPAAYEKSRKAVDAILGIARSRSPKMIQVTEYLLDQCGDITPLAVQKALYYVQGFYYAFYGEFLFDEDCEAWAQGPVYREIYFRYRDYQFDPIEGREKFECPEFSSAEKSILDSVVRNVCCYSGRVLEAFTRAELPWLEARGGFMANAATNRIISRETMGKYFSAAKEKYGMINPNDIKGYTYSMFEQI